MQKRFFKNYLRVFANIGVQESTIERKKDIIDKFIVASKFIFSNDKLKYDMDGKGIGLSKGSPLIGKKALDNRLVKYGYNQVISISTEVQNSKCKSRLNFLPLINSRPAYCEVTFTWDYDITKNKEMAISIFEKLNEIIEVNYGYAYLALLNTSIVEEWKTNIFGSSYRPKGRTNLG